jgi:4-amino-4-deoxy-L-arabinose transferase-like glycosyltransferase
MRRITTLLGFFLPLAFYFALATPQLDLPGLHNDEAVEAGLQASQIINGQSISTFREAGITLADRTYPLMVQDYIGAFNVYFALPFFALLGSTVVALRFYTVCIGAVTISLAYGFLATTVNKRAAFVAAMLLAVSPSFIFWQRQGVYVASLTTTFAVAALWVAVWWSRSHNPVAAYKRAALLGLLCGLGLYAKLLFIWVIGGMIGAGVILLFPDIIKLFIKRQTSNFLGNTQSPIASLQSLIPNLFSFSVALLLALIPLFAYNIQTGGTFLSLGTNLTTSYYGVNNLDFASNFAARLDHFQAVIAGRDHLWYLGGSFGNGMWGSALSLVSLVIVGRWLFRRQRTRLPLFILLTLALGLVQSSFTVSGLFPTHLSIFTPLPAILIALTAETILDPFHEPIFIHVTGPNLGAMLGGLVSGGLAFLNIGMIVVAVGLASLWGNDLVVTGQYHVVLNQTGGLGPHSDAVYRLIDTLKEHSDDPVVAMDWGFAPQVRMLTNDAIQPQEVFGYTWEPDEGFIDRLNAALDQPEALFVFHFPQETIFPRREQFDAALAARGWVANTVAIISRRDGAPIFEILSVHPPS